MTHRSLIILSAVLLFGAGCLRSVPENGSVQKSVPPVNIEASSKTKAFNLEACLSACTADPFSTSDTAQRCRENCRVDKAIATSDASYCDPLLGKDGRFFEGEAEGFKSCMETLAIEKRAPKFCEQAAKKYKQYSDVNVIICIGAAIQEVKDSSVCNSLEEEANKAGCLEAISNRE